MLTRKRQALLIAAYLVMLANAAVAAKSSDRVDLIAGGDAEWSSADPLRWGFGSASLRGGSLTLDGKKTDPEANAFLLSRRVFGGDKHEHYVESAYIKTVENGHWVVRATGELDISEGQPLRLLLEREGDDYRVWDGDRLVVTYRKPGGYHPPGRLQLRVANSAVRITGLEVTAESISGIDGSADESAP